MNINQDSVLKKYMYNLNHNLLSFEISPKLETESSFIREKKQEFDIILFCLSKYHLNWRLSPVLFRELLTCT